MSTELSVVPASAIARFNEENVELMEAMEANEEGFSLGDLVTVPTPAGGATKWTIEKIDGDEVTEAITGVLVLVQKYGVLWPTEDPVEGATPVLRTFDLKIAELACDPEDIPDHMIETLEKFKLSEATETEPATYDWENLPYNQWGSGKNGSKLCTEQRMLFIQRMDDVFPLLVRCQPGSLKNVTKFLKQLPSASLVPWRAIVELRLVEAKNGAGQKYSQIMPRLVGKLSREDGELIKSQITDHLSKGLAKRAAVEDPRGYPSDAYDDDTATAGAYTDAE